MAKLLGCSIGNVSIRALAWRATGVLGFEPRHMVFQSAPSRGGRPICTIGSVSICGVSIRALAWRATGLDLLR